MISGGPSTPSFAARVPRSIRLIKLGRLFPAMTVSFPSYASSCGILIIRRGDRLGISCVRFR